jgi:hypothetical protein
MVGPNRSADFLVRHPTGPSRFGGAGAPRTEVSQPLNYSLPGSPDPGTANKPNGRKIEWVQSAEELYDS